MSHVGDIVDKNIPAQWELARSCMDVIHGNVPYGISVGNHDMTGEGIRRCSKSSFQSHTSSLDWYGGAYEGSPMGPHTSGTTPTATSFFSRWNGLYLYAPGVQCSGRCTGLGQSDHLHTPTAGR
ncbi:MAG: hypothetical protein R3C56_13125 [Pirellulaceae bacterium]